MHVHRLSDDGDVYETSPILGFTRAVIFRMCLGFTAVWVFPKGLLEETTHELIVSKAEHIKNSFAQLAVTNRLTNYLSFTFIRFVTHCFTNETTNEVQRDANISLK